MTTYIYSLFCPITNKMMYIGKGNNPKRRLSEHMSDIRDMPKDKLKWINKLKKKGLRPILEILDIVPMYEWKFWEDWWSSYFKSYGVVLLNKRCGNGLSYANSRCYKQGNVPHNKGKKKIGNKYI